MIINLLWHLGISLGLFLYVLLSFVLARGMYAMLAEKNRPRLGLVCAFVVFVAWWLVIVGLILHAVWSYYWHGPQRDLI